MGVFEDAAEALGFYGVEDLNDFDTQDAWIHSSPGRERAEVAIVSAIRNKLRAGDARGGTIQKPDKGGVAALVDIYKHLPEPPWEEIPAEYFWNFAGCPDVIHRMDEGERAGNRIVVGNRAYVARIDLPSKWRVYRDNGASHGVLGYELVDPVYRKEKDAMDMAYAFATGWKTAVDRAIAAAEEEAPARRQDRAVTIRQWADVDDAATTAGRRLNIRPKTNPPEGASKKTERAWKAVQKAMETRRGYVKALAAYDAARREDDQLEMGTEEEMEHTDSRAVARRIAMDHLKEDPNYYTKLAQCGLIKRERE